MIYLELFWGFLQVGLFAFGGAYGAIPLIRDIVLSYGWLDDEMLTYMIAVSESTPGPIMVNLATYVGFDKAGVLGAALATLAVVLPAFFIILLIVAAFRSAMKNKYFNALLRGVKPSVIGIVLATGIFMTAKPLFLAGGFDLKAALITAVLAAIFFLPPAFKKKKLSPILLIVIAAGIGVIAYGI